MRTNRYSPINERVARRIRIVLTTVSGLVAVGAFIAPAIAQTSNPHGSEPVPTVSLWGTGEALGAYHNVSADCETYVHSFGRNAAWGRWSMLRNAVALSVVTSDTDAHLLFRCRDGSACVEERQDGERMLSEHRVRYLTRGRAESVAAQLNGIEDLCVA